MGCCSSSVDEFRGLYQQMLRTFELLPSSKDFSSEPKKHAIGKRTAIFDGMNRPEVKNVDNAITFIEDDPFHCKWTEKKLQLLLKKSEEFWSLGDIHPYNNLLSREMAVCLLFARENFKFEKNLREGKYTRRPRITRSGKNWSLFRWDFRLWLLGMCEFYHTLALLAESKSIPSNAVMWFMSMQQKKDNFFQLDSNGNLFHEARLAMEKCADLRITEKNISKKLLKLLNNEMHSIFSSPHGPGSVTVELTRESVFREASLYWMNKGEVIQIIEMRSNVLQGDPKKKKNDLKNPIPIVALIEWITIRYVRSFCGPEENLINYFPPLSATEELLPTLFATEELLPTLFATEDWLPTLFASDEEFCTLFATEELLPTLFATEELLPTLFATEDWLPTLFASDEELCTLFASEELLPTLFSTEELLPTLFATEELLPTLFAFDYEIERPELKLFENEAFLRQLLELYAEALREKLMLEFEALRERTTIECLEQNSRPVKEPPDWLQVIQRLDEIDHALSGNLASEEKDELVLEKANLMNALQGLFDFVGENSNEVSSKQCVDNLYDEMKLNRLCADRSIADSLCIKIFLESVAGCSSSSLTTLEQFRSFASNFVRSLSPGSDGSDSMANKWAKYGPPIISLPRITISERCIFPPTDNMEGILEKFSTFSGEKEFLRDLSDLKAAIGADGNKEKQKEFIQKLLDSMPDNLKRFNAEDGKKVCEEKIDENAELQDYSGFHSAAARFALNFCLKATACNADEEPFTNYINLLKDSQLPDDDEKQHYAASLMPFTTDAVYISTAVLRAFEDTGEDEMKGKSFEEWQNGISYDWFERGMIEASKAFDLPLDDIIKNSLNYLRAMGEQENFSDPSDEELEHGKKSLLKRAYYLLEKMGRKRGENGVCLKDIIAMCLFGQLRESFGNESLFHNFLNYAFEEDAVKNRRSRKLAAFKDAKEVADAIYKLLIARKTEDDLYKEFFSLSRGCRAIPLSSEESIVVPQTNTVMNIDIFIDNFQTMYENDLQPFLFSPSIMSSVWKEAVIAATTAELGREYLQCEQECGPTDSCANNTSRVPFTARRYIRFLSYICGWVMTPSIYAKSYHTKEMDLLEDETFLHLTVPDAFPFLLKEIADRQQLCPLSKEEEGGIVPLSYGKTFFSFSKQEENAAFAHDHDRLEGAPAKESLVGMANLFSIAHWYGTYRVARLWPTYYDRWERDLSHHLPFSSSRQDRAARRPLLLRLQQLTEALSTEEKGHNEVASEEGYFSTEAVVALLREQYNGFLWLEAIGYSTAARRARHDTPLAIGRKKIPLGKENRRNAEENASNADRVPTVNRPPPPPPTLSDYHQWVETHVIACVNRDTCGRQDFSTTEMHWSRFRFVLEFMHHCMESFFRSEEVCKEVEGMFRAQVRGEENEKKPNSKNDLVLSGASRPLDMDVWGGYRSAKMRPTMSRAETVPDIHCSSKKQTCCTYADVEHRQMVIDAVQCLWGRCPELLERVQQELDAIATTTTTSSSAEDSAPVDPEVVGHVIASQLVGERSLRFWEAVEAYQASREEQFAKDFDELWFSGKNLQQVGEQMSRRASYWERLRFLLPHFHSPSHRQRRRRLYETMDRKGKGYVNVPDVHYSIANILHLQDFREDPLPILFRAFFATKENMYTTQHVMYLTSGSEQLISPPEFCGFLSYFYQYFELYYMFDVLTCAGRLNASGHVDQTRVVIPITAADRLSPLPPMPSLPSDTTTTPLTSPPPLSSSRTLSSVARTRGVPAFLLPSSVLSSERMSAGKPASAVTALHRAADDPFQVTLEASAIPKVVNVHQFCLGQFLLRRWGFPMKDPERLFRGINRRCAETGEMDFTSFAIWASKHNLHPDGPWCYLIEESDALADIEETILRLYGVGEEETEEGQKKQSFHTTGESEVDTKDGEKRTEGDENKVVG